MANEGKMKNRNRHGSARNDRLQVEHTGQVNNDDSKRGQLLNFPQLRRRAVQN